MRLPTVFECLSPPVVFLASPGQAGREQTSTGLYVKLLVLGIRAERIRVRPMPAGPR